MKKEAVISNVVYSVENACHTWAP